MEETKYSKNHKKYYEKNKEIISRKQTVKIKCECGVLVSKVNMRKHQNTLKHQYIMKIVELENSTHKH